jgi:hypothetical protein
MDGIVVDKVAVVGAAVRWGGGDWFDIAFVVTAIEFLARICESMFSHLRPLLAALHELLNVAAFRVYHVQHPDFFSIRADNAVIPTRSVKVSTFVPLPIEDPTNRQMVRRVFASWQRQPRCQYPPPLVLPSSLRLDVVAEVPFSWTGIAHEHPAQPRPRQRRQPVPSYLIKPRLGPPDHLAAEHEARSRVVSDQPH